MSLSLATNAERTKYVCSILFKKITQKCNDNWDKIEMMMKLTSEFDSWQKICHPESDEIKDELPTVLINIIQDMICSTDNGLCEKWYFRQNFLNNNFTRHQLNNLPVKIQWSQKPSDITRYSKEHKCRSIVSHFHDRIRNKIINEMNIDYLN